MEEIELALFIERNTNEGGNFYNRTDIVQRGDQIFAINKANDANEQNEPTITEVRITLEDMLAWLKEKSEASPFHSTFQVSQKCFEFFADNPAFAEIAKNFNECLAEFKWQSSADCMTNHEILTWNKDSQSYEMTECQGNSRRIFAETLESVKITEDDAAEWLMQRVRDKSGEFEMKDAIVAIHFPDITEMLINERNDPLEKAEKTVEKKHADVER